MAKKYAKVLATIFMYGTAGAAAATALGNVRAIKALPKTTRDEINITDVDEEDKLFVAGDADNGDVQIVLGMDEAQYATLLGFGGDQHSFSITYSSGGVRAFEGFVKEIGEEIEGEKGEIRVPVTFRVSGTSSFTPAA